MKGRLDLPLEALEDELAAYYKEHLIVTGRLTSKQADDAQYSYALSELRIDDKTTREEREGRFRRFVVGVLDLRLRAQQTFLRQHICEEGNYCNIRDHEAVAIITTTLDGVIALFIGFPVPAATVAVWLVKTRWLDKLCDCKKRPTSTDA